MTLNRLGVNIGGENPPAFPNVFCLWLGSTIPSTTTSCHAPANPTEAQPLSPEPVIASEARQSRSDPQASPAPEPTHPFARWQDDTILLETNIDNATGEQRGFAMKQIFSAGALDVWRAPIQMKLESPQRPALGSGPC